MKFVYDGAFIYDITVRLWQFLDFSLRQTVGIAGDDIMYSETCL